MIEKHTFVEIINNLQVFDEHMSKLEKLFDVYFDNNWMTKVLDGTLQLLPPAFFSSDQMDKIEDEIRDSQIETIEHLIYHFCFNGNFGAEEKYVKDIYIREGTDPRSAYNADDLYDIIIDYLTSKEDVTFKLDI